MKRNTALTMIMMLTSVAAAVAAPEDPTSELTKACVEARQVAAATTHEAILTRHVPVAVAGSAAGQRVKTGRHAAMCADDVTAPYRLMHHGGMKLPSAACADAT